MAFAFCSRGTRIMVLPRGEDTMHPKLRKVAATFGLIIIGSGAAYSAQFVTNEVRYLYSRFEPSGEAFSNDQFAAWAPADSALNVSADLSPEAIREVLNTLAPSTITSGSIASQ